MLTKDEGYKRKNETAESVEGYWNCRYKSPKFSSIELDFLVVTQYALMFCTLHTILE